MTWKCAAIDHGVAIFPDGTIAPCCETKFDYRKPISELYNSNRFADLKTQTPPLACDSCVNAEKSNLISYRTMFNTRCTSAPGLQFVDIRNTNHCNLKCRYCGPWASSSWSKELGDATVLHCSIDQYKDILITDDLHWMYFTGGEPLINPEHWDLLKELVDSGRSEKISLMYNTNLTTIRYKDTDVLDLWGKFKSVQINCSIDAVGSPLEYIRSGCTWAKIEHNLQTLINSRHESKIRLTLTPVLSILNIWFVAELYDYAALHNIPVEPIVLKNPSYLALDVIPDQLQTQALAQIESIKKYISMSLFSHLSGILRNNAGKQLINQTIGHVLLLDNNRNEKLFNLLPFKEISKNHILRFQSF
jgi:sulfatase maturation enzyme AslB (radical SAM superfamily)